MNIQKLQIEDTSTEVTRFNALMESHPVGVQPLQMQDGLCHTFTREAT
jgi:hypothetical protein